MPQYELCYILSALVGDDQVQNVADEVKGYIEKFGGTEVIENHLGKKKLAYPIKKTKNGHYVVVRFAMPSLNVPALETKIRTNTSVIRHLVVKLDEHLKRLEKDQAEQAKLSQNRNEEASEEKPQIPTPVASVVTPELKLDMEPEKDKASLDEQIEAALNDDII